MFVACLCAALAGQAGLSRLAAALNAAQRQSVRENLLRDQARAETPAAIADIQRGFVALSDFDDALRAARESLAHPGDPTSAISFIMLNNSHLEGHSPAGERPAHRSGAFAGGAAETGRAGALAPIPLQGVPHDPICNGCRCMLSLNFGHSFRPAANPAKL